MTTIHISRSLSAMALGSTKSNFSARIWHIRSQRRRASWPSRAVGAAAAQAAVAASRAALASRSAVALAVATARLT